MQFFQLYDDQSLVSHPNSYQNVFWVEQWAVEISLKKAAGWDALTAFLENMNESLFRWNSDKLTSFNRKKTK